MKLSGALVPGDRTGMRILHATKDFAFSTTVFGEGRLEKGKDYYTFGKFAKDVAAMGAGVILEGEPRVQDFSPEATRDLRPGSRILLLHSGGYGDTITVGIFLALMMRRFGVNFDVCGDPEKHAYILKPMGLEGDCLSYPPLLEEVESYDYLLRELAAFAANPRALLEESPLKILCRAFGLPLQMDGIGFRVPRETSKRLELPQSKRIRVGINFDSNGAVKSYPEELQALLVDSLLDLGFELFFFGTRPLSDEIEPGTELLHDLTGRTRIPELAALLDQMDLVLGVDSFVAHLSGILGKKTIVLLSTTGEDYFDHYPAVFSRASKIECAPCFSTGDTCPLGYPRCRAFYHESIQPGILLQAMIREITRMYGYSHG